MKIMSFFVAGWISSGWKMQKYMQICFKPLLYYMSTISCFSLQTFPVCFPMSPLPLCFHDHYYLCKHKSVTISVSFNVCFERAIVKYLNKYTFNNTTESICTVTPLKIFVQLHCLKGWRTTLYYWRPFVCMLIYGFTTSIHWLIHWFYRNLSISLFRDGCTYTDSTFAMYRLQQQMQLGDCITFWRTNT